MSIFNLFRRKDTPSNQSAASVPRQNSSTTREHEASAQLLRARNLLLEAAKDKALGKDGQARTARASARDVLKSILLRSYDTDAASRAWNLLDNADCDKIKMTLDALCPLSKAALEGDEPGVRRCLVASVDLHERAINGYTPLHWAMEMGNLDVTRALLDAGARPNETAVGHWTPLHMAAARGRVALVELLLDRGANIDAVRLGGYTPLHQAARGNHVGVIKTLISRGAAVDTKTDETAEEKSMSAVDLARAKGHMDAVDALKG